jgi:hypothetical protein
MHDWVVQTVYLAHLVIMALTGALLATAAAATTAAAAAAAAAPPPPACQTRSGQKSAVRAPPRARRAAMTAAGAGAAAAAAAAPRLAAAAASLRRTWAVCREPLMLVGAPYKCGMVELSYAVHWALSYGAGHPEQWCMTIGGALQAATQSRPCSMAALGVLSAACHSVSGGRGVEREAGRGKSGARGRGPVSAVRHPPNAMHSPAGGPSFAGRRTSPREVRPCGRPSRAEATQIKICVVEKPRYPPNPRTPRILAPLATPRGCTPKPDPD